MHGWIKGRRERDKWMDDLSVCIGLAHHCFSVDGCGACINSVSPVPAQQERESKQRSK